MATRRMILKSDFESPKWLHLSVRQRYLFCGLTLFADDDGILPVHLIQNRIFFYEYDGTKPEDIQQDLSDLDVAAFIQIYTSEEGDRYIQISKWWDKQFIDKKLYKPSVYQKPPDYLPRPEDLSKRLNRSFYDSSSKPLDQNRTEERRGEKTTLEENKTSADVDLPFDRYGKAKYE